MVSEKAIKSSFGIIPKDLFLNSCMVWLVAKFFSNKSTDIIATLSGREDIGRRNRYSLSEFFQNPKSTFYNFPYYSSLQKPKKQYKSFVMNYNTQLCNTAWGKKLLAQVARRTCF